MKIFSAINFRAETAAGISEFYGHLLGMGSYQDGTALSFGYGTETCRIYFDIGDFPRREPQGNDFYWKIGLTVRNLDAAVESLTKQGWPVTDPRQFQQIGYLCHLRDPAGNAIELLQQGFEGREGGVPEGHPIGSQATLAHITLRVRDIEACRTYLEGELGLRLMSVQPVPDFGFTLYFFSWNEEPLPNPDLEAVENREWLWARPYPLLELQHIHQDGVIRKPQGEEAGFAALSFSDGEERAETVDIDRLF
jgi:catechol 2,3-dioxygenase-like lactoylglutathione lyase family enzyme